MKKCLEIFYFQFIVGADGDWIRIHQVEKKKRKKKRKEKGKQVYDSWHQMWIGYDT
jgi:hypothetical protein